MDGNAPDFGELIFALLISYVGALEFIFVLRHLCHFSGRHAMESGEAQNLESLENLKEKLQRQLVDATAMEQQTGTNTMQDGIAYTNGFRVEPERTDIDRLKEQINTNEAKEKRRAEIEAELARQKLIEEETRKQLAKAEAELARHRAEVAAAEVERKRKQKEEEEEERQRAKLEEAENFRKMLEAEKEREIEQKRIEDEREKEEEEAEKTRKLLEAERQKESAQRKLELQDEEENEFDDLQRQQEEQELEYKNNNALEKFLNNEIIQDASNEQQKRNEQKQKQKQKQKVIEENARKFLEAENEMIELQQQQMLESIQNDEQIPIIEEPILKRTQKPIDAAAPGSSGYGDQMLQTVKTQFGQGSIESFTLSSKPLLFPSISDDASSNEPHSSKQSSFSTQPSDEMATGTDDATMMTAMGLQVPQHERQEPDGEDNNNNNNNTPTVQYTDEYLRSLDGLKVRPLLREDGTGRRRAFKKRRSSGSSTSSRDSRTSRDEELKMFASLEEEEFRKVQQGDNDNEYTPIKYTNDPTLKVKGHHHRRHKRSPAKDMKTPENSLVTSLDMLGEEGSDPWGEVVPEHYKDTDFWRREKAMSIDEEEIELESTAKSENIVHSENVNNKPNSSSFEEATVQQNEEALTTLQKQRSKKLVEQEMSSEKTNEKETNQSQSQNKEANLQSSKEIEDNASPSSSRLRRSPRIDEMDQYEERLRESEKPKNLNQSEMPNTPTVTIHSPDDFSPWRDDHGLILQGLSDFYDFTASTNPSRSRSPSRNPSPAPSSMPSTPQPKNVALGFENRRSNPTGLQKDSSDASIDTSSTFNINEAIGNFVDVKSKNIAASIKSFHNESIDLKFDENNPSIIERNSVPQNIVECNENENANPNEMNQLIDSLRMNQRRSRSRSPLPTLDNLERSLERRRTKLIKQNDEIFESQIKRPLKNDEPKDINENTSSIEYNEMNQLNETLKMNQRRSRSRSRSPLPTPESLTKNTNDVIDIDAKLIPTISVDTNDSSYSYEASKDNFNEMNQLIEGLRQSQRRSRSRSRSPLPTPANLERSLEARRSKLVKQNDEFFETLAKDQDEINSGSLSEDEENEESEENDYNASNSFVKRTLQPSLTQNIDRRRSRSRSPLPTIKNIERIQESEELFEKSTPSITVNEIAEEESSEDSDDSENISDLVASLRTARSRSRSKSPMRIPTPANLNESINNRREKLIELNDQLQEHLEKRAQTPQNPRLVVEYVYEFEEAAEETGTEEIYESRSRSQTPSPTRSRSQSPNGSDLYFHRMLNLESSQNRTLAKDTEERESLLAERQRDLDKEALQKLKTASEETELRTLTPMNEDEEHDDEQHDTIVELPSNVRLQKLRSTPSTPDYDRTISEEWRDFQRIKKEMLSSGFKRSKYVGESMELGSEYEPLRREAAAFRRSRSPSPSLEEFPSKGNREDTTRQTAAERRHIQDEILKELILSSRSSNGANDNDNNNNNADDRYGAKPKGDRNSITDEYLRTESEMDNSAAVYEDMRREMNEFRRSRSCSRSPINEHDIERKDLIAIEIEAAKREFQDQLLDKLSTTVPQSFQDFSRHLNADFLDDRRASDSALIQKPDMSLKTKTRDGNNVYDTMDIEPEEYHHYRRFSLNQEQQIEEYPDDDDDNDNEFICLSQVEVSSLDGTRTWIREDFYNENIDNYVQYDIDDEQVHEDGGEENFDKIHLVDEEDTEEDSEDERQTVVEVEDEIDTDICDFNERGPTDESHHEQSECEEADRAIDHYANHGARDWQSVNDVVEIINADDMEIDVMEGEEGAVGGIDNDNDSFEIDQIYGEAIKNRKQSGILREYDSILLEMQNNFENKSDNETKINDETTTNDQEHYALWAKTRTLEKVGTRKLSVTFMETEKQDTELRYLGDANMSARQSTRLRSRYGYGHVSQTNRNNDIEDNDYIDINYRPKREYNWRKNFKLDDDHDHGDDDDDDVQDREDGVDENDGEGKLNSEENCLDENFEDIEDNRKFSLGGESITLYSRSPDRISPDMMFEEVEEQKNFNGELIIENKENASHNNSNNNNNNNNSIEKPKKKKSKKKSHRESKDIIENRYKNDAEDDDSDSQVYYNRRSSSRQLENESPKRKSRSRRGSRSSIESIAVFSPRSSLVPGDNIQDNNVSTTTDICEPTKKKVKKRKKPKDVFTVTQNIKEEEQEQPHEPHKEEIIEQKPNQMRTSDHNERIAANISTTSSSATTTTTTTTTTASTATTATRATTSIDSFDILKDANFYPLF